MPTKHDPVYSKGDIIECQNGNSYQIKEVLNGGAFAKPYLVENIKTHESAILKFNQQVNESKIVSAVRQIYIDHGEPATVVDVLDWPSNEITGWYGHVEGLAEGQNCRDSRPTEQQSLEIALHFAKTLRYCAANNIAYLDIKPLSHIFWVTEKNTTSPKIKIIDWNAGKQNATFIELRQDVIKFCESLPEFFTGEEKQARFVHPLYWDPGSDNDLLPVTYSTWILLVTLSLDWAGPTIPELEKVLRMPDTYSHSNRYVDVIVKAWDVIIEQIKGAINLSQFNPAYTMPISIKPQQGFELISQAKKLRPNKQLVDLMQDMESKADEVKKWLIEKRSGFTINRSDNEPDMLALRLLCPQNQQYAILLSAFEIWKNSTPISEVEVDPDWQSFIIGIVESDFRTLGLILPALKRKIEQRSNLTEYLAEWLAKLNALGKELEVWIILNTGSEEEILNLSGAHPVVKKKQDRIRIRLNLRTNLEKLFLELTDAYNCADFKKIIKIFAQNEADLYHILGDHKEQLDRYKNAAKLFGTIDHLVSSWNKADIEVFNILYESEPHDTKKILGKYYEMAEHKLAFLNLIEKLPVLSLNDEFSTPNFSKFIPDKESKQFRDMIDFLQNWAGKELKILNSQVEEGFKYNKFDLESVEIWISKTSRLLRLTQEFGFKELSAILENLNAKLKEEKSGTENFILELEKYYQSLNNKGDRLLEHGGTEEITWKIPRRIKELLQADKVSFEEGVRGDSNLAQSQTTEIPLNDEQKNNEIVNIKFEDGINGLLDRQDNISTQIAEMKDLLPKPRGKMAIGFSYLVPAFLSILSMSLIIIFGYYTINVISPQFSQISTDLKALSDAQKTPIPVVVTIVTTEPSIIPGNELATPETSPVPSSVVLEFSADGKNIQFTDENGESILRTNNQKNFKYTLLETSGNKKKISLSLFWDDKNIKDATKVPLQIKAGVFLYDAETGKEVEFYLFKELTENTDFTITTTSEGFRSISVPVWVQE